MKKLICASFLVLASAGASFAAAALPTTPPQGFTPSNNVKWAYETSSVGGTTAQDIFSIATKHTAGDKVYGTTNGTGIIYYSVSAPGTALVGTDAPDLPGTSTDSTVTGGAGNWTAM